MQTSREEGDNHLYEFGIFRTAPTVSLIRRETLASIASKKFGNARGSVEGGGEVVTLTCKSTIVASETNQNRMSRPATTAKIEWEERASFSDSPPSLCVLAWRFNLEASRQKLNGGGDTDKSK